MANPIPKAQKHPRLLRTGIDRELDASNGSSHDPENNQHPDDGGATLASSTSSHWSLPCTRFREHCGEAFYVGDHLMGK
jgi:hypothetical protein